MKGIFIHKGDSIMEKKSRGVTSVVPGDCRAVFPHDDDMVNRAPATNVVKTSIHFCGIPKIGTTFTRSLIKSIPKCHVAGLCERKLATNGVSKHEIPNDTYTFMWIREPYGRLFAAYENKLYHPNKYYWKVLGGNIVKSIRKVPDNEMTSPLTGYNITFAELIKFILSLFVKNRGVDIHFRPMNKICNPCETRFDFIGRLESFTEAVSQVCNTFGELGLLESENGPIPCSSTTFESYVFNRVKHLFNVLKKSVPTQSSDGIYKEIMMRTWSSYQIRGMMSKSQSMPWSDNELRLVTHDQYVEALRAAMDASNNKTELKAQRREAMLQAYRTVSMADMMQLRDYVRTECRLFGYEEEPADLFKASRMDSPPTTFDYFNGLLL